jgi:hypothetical protein
MKTKRAALILLAISAAPAAAQTMGYAGEQGREIKALSAQETADLLAGRGMGMARAGELNHHPGPAHMLELKDKLALTPDQFAAASGSFARMAAAAKPLGAELVGMERALDAAFAAGSLTADELRRRADEIAAIQGRLRAVHLGAHLEMRGILTPQQVAAYDGLRGYGGPALAPAVHHGVHPG